MLFHPAHLHQTCTVTTFLRRAAGPTMDHWISANIDIQAFVHHPQPAGLFAINWATNLLVLDDGACALVEDHGFEHDPNARRHLATPDPIGYLRQTTLLGQAGQARLHLEKGRLNDDEFRFYGEDRPFLMPMLINNAALALPFTPDPLSMDAHRKRIAEGLQDWANAFQDPLIVDFDDTKHWNQDEEASLLDVLTDTLAALGHTGKVWVYAPFDDQPLHLGAYSSTHSIIEPLDEAINHRALWLAQRCVAFDTFQGFAWEYNDGAHTRQSGYDQGGATIGIINTLHLSAHDRLRAHDRTKARLEALLDSNSADQQRAFFDTTLPFP